MYEGARVHVKMCAVGARARAFDCREHAEQGRETVRSYSEEYSRVRAEQCVAVAPGGRG